MSWRSKPDTKKYVALLTVLLLLLGACGSSDDSGSYEMADTTAAAAAPGDDGDFEEISDDLGGVAPENAEEAKADTLGRGTSSSPPT